MAYLTAAKAALSAGRMTRQAFSAQNNQVDEVLNTTLKGVMAVGALTGTFVGVRYLFRARKEDRAEDTALKAGTAAYHAQILGNALAADSFFKWVTIIDKENVYRIIRNFPDQIPVADIQQAYRSLYGHAIMDDISLHFYPREQNKILSYLNY